MLKSKGVMLILHTCSKLVRLGLEVDRMIANSTYLLERQHKAFFTDLDVIDASASDGEVAVRLADAVPHSCGCTSFSFVFV